LNITDAMAVRVPSDSIVEGLAVRIFFMDTIRFS
jgi:hypothetical protein